MPIWKNYALLIKINKKKIHRMFWMSVNLGKRNQYSEHWPIYFVEFGANSCGSCLYFLTSSLDLDLKIYNEQITILIKIFDNRFFFLLDSFSYLCFHYLLRKLVSAISVPSGPFAFIILLIRLIFNFKGDHFVSSRFSTPDLYHSISLPITTLPV